MGREASGSCTWGADSGAVVAHLDGEALTVRGAFRARVARSAIRAVAVRDDAVCFAAGPDDVVLTLGAAEAATWANALRTPPPTLAKKLGITPQTRVVAVGTIDDDALAEAIASGAAGNAEACDLLIVRTDDRTELETALDAHAAHVRSSRPLWIVSVKGRNAPLGEAAIREALRSRRCIDTKVASVSDRLTASRFVAR